MAKKIEDIELKSGVKAGRFLELCEARVRFRYDDGTLSPLRTVEFVRRKGLDSVAVAVFCVEKNRALLALTGQVRVPALCRCDKEKWRRLFLLETVAGSVEPEDSGRNGLLLRAAAEVYEEAGFKVEPEEVVSLGAPFYPSPVQSSEKIYPFAVKVKRSRAVKPPGDGSPLEQCLPPVRFHPLEKVLEMARKGEICDAKTEIVAARLAILLGLPVKAGAGGRRKRNGVRPPGD